MLALKPTPAKIWQQEALLIKQSKNPIAVLVTFIEIGAARCIPCKAMQPIMKAVAEEYKGQVKVVFHDVWTPQGKDGRHEI